MNFNNEIIPSHMFDRIMACFDNVDKKLDEFDMKLDKIEEQRRACRKSPDQPRHTRAGYSPWQSSFQPNAYRKPMGQQSSAYPPPAPPYGRPPIISAQFAACESSNPARYPTTWFYNRQSTSFQPYSQEEYPKPHNQPPYIGPYQQPSNMAPNLEWIPPRAADSRRLSPQHPRHLPSSRLLPVVAAVPLPPLQRSPSYFPTSSAAPLPAAAADVVPSFNLSPPAPPCSPDISEEKGGLLDNDPPPPTVISQPDSPDTSPTLVPHVVLVVVPISKKIEISEGVQRVCSSCSSGKRIAIKEVHEFDDILIPAEGFIKFRRISSREHIQMSGQAGRQRSGKGRCSTIQYAFDPGGDTSMIFADYRFPP